MVILFFLNLKINRKATRSTLIDCTSQRHLYICERAMIEKLPIFAQITQEGSLDNTLLLFESNNSQKFSRAVYAMGHIFPSMLWLTETGISLHFHVCPNNSEHVALFPSCHAFLTVNLRCQNMI